MMHDNEQDTEQDTESRRLMPKCSDADLPSADTAAKARAIRGTITTCMVRIADCFQKTDAWIKDAAAVSYGQM